MFADVLEGYNGTIFAYGQTSSGKTHTMEVSSRCRCLRWLELSAKLEVHVTAEMVRLGSLSSSE